MPDPNARYSKPTASPARSLAGRILPFARLLVTKRSPYDPLELPRHEDAVAGAEQGDAGTTSPEPDKFQQFVHVAVGYRC